MFLFKGQLDIATGHVFKTYTPLLNGLEDSNPDFLGKAIIHYIIVCIRHVTVRKLNYHNEL